MTAPFDILTRIAERGPALRLAEQKVAQVVLEDLAGAAAASITARRSGPDDGASGATHRARGPREPASSPRTV